MRIFVNRGFKWKRKRQLWMSRPRKMLGRPYCHWPRDTGMIYYLRNLGDWELISILTISLLVKFLCEAINVPSYTLTGNYLYIYYQWVPMLCQMTHWGMWSIILVSWMKFTVTTHWNRSWRMRSSWENHVSIILFVLPLSHTCHRRTRPKTISKSSRLDHICVW